MLLVPTWDDILKAGAALTLFTGVISKVYSFFQDGRNARRYKRERDDYRIQIEGMIEDRKRAKEWEDSLPGLVRESPTSSTPRRGRRPTTKSFLDEHLTSARSNDKTISEPVTSLSKSLPKTPGNETTNDI